MAVRDSFTAGDVLDAADLTDTFASKAPIVSPTFTGTVTIPNVTLSSWTAFTPTFSHLTVGNGTLVNCKYARTGNQIICQIGLVWGSTTTFTLGLGDFTLPVTAKSLTGNPNLGLARYVDASPSVHYSGFVVHILTTHARLQRNVVSGSEIIAGEVGPTAPFTWTTNDEMHAIFVYEAA